MFRAVLGNPLMEPALSSESTTGRTEGGLTQKYSCMSASVGVLRRSLL